jgi:hypothetical protein
VGNRRKFFENFARAHEFDPLSVRDWIAHRPILESVKVLLFSLSFFTFFLFSFTLFLSYLRGRKAKGGIRVPLGYCFITKRTLCRHCITFSPKFPLRKIRPNKVNPAYVINCNLVYNIVIYLYFNQRQA